MSTKFFYGLIDKLDTILDDSGGLRQFRKYRITKALLYQLS